MIQTNVFDRLSHRRSPLSFALGPPMDHVDNFSPLRVGRPDVERYPHFNRTRPLTVTPHPTDSLNAILVHTF